MMRRFWMLAVIITCAVECLAGDGREDLSALQSELDQFQGARRAVENNPGGSQADKLRKLFADETIKRLYNKYPAFPSATWENYVADLEKELKSVERKYKMPRYSPGADELMIEILEPTLAQLKKAYEGLGRKDVKRKELKKKIDDLQTQLENHRSQAKAEKEKWENKSTKIVAERDAALTKIAEKVNGELDAFAELHYMTKINQLKPLQNAGEGSLRDVGRASAQVTSKKNTSSAEASADYVAPPTDDNDDLDKALYNVCKGERVTREEFGYLFATERERIVRESLRKYGYWALQIDGEDLAIQVGHTDNGRDGIIREGLGGGFTYPQWMPEDDAVTIWKMFKCFRAIEEAFRTSRFCKPGSGCRDRFVPEGAKVTFDTEAWKHRLENEDRDKSRQERRARNEARRRKSALFGLNEIEKKRFDGKTARQIYKIRGRKAQEKADREHEAAVRAAQRSDLKRFK